MGPFLQGIDSVKMNELFYFCACASSGKLIRNKLHYKLYIISFAGTIGFVFLPVGFLVQLGDCENYSTGATSRQLDTLNRIDPSRHFASQNRYCSGI